MLSNPDNDILRATVFFGSLPAPVFDAIVARGRIATIAAGREIFCEGEPAKSVFAVVSGLVKLSVAKRDGGEAVVEIFHPGASFAEALAFQKQPYPVSATALIESRIFSVSNSVVQRAILDNPDALGAILGSTYVHLHRLVRQVEQLKSRSAIQRVAEFILASVQHSAHSGAIEIPYEKQVLASLLGMKPETLSRIFRRLEEHGVAVEGRQIVLSDMRALRAVLEQNDAV